MWCYRAISNFFKKISVNQIETDFNIVAKGSNRDLGSASKKWGDVHAQRFYGDGSNLTNVAGGSGIENVVEDTTPELGGNLDAGTNDITNAGQIHATTFHGDGSNLTNLPASGGLQNVVEDTTPQLGGNLDAQGNNITGIHTIDGINTINSSSIFVKISNLFVMMVTNAYVNFYKPITASSDAVYNIGASDKRFNQVHAVEFHGDGSNLTGLPSGGIASVSEDTTPQLGGELDVNNQVINNVNDVRGATTILFRIAGATKMYIGSTFTNFYNNVMPNADATRDIGSQTARWRGIWGANRLHRVKTTWAMTDGDRTLNANENGYRISVTATANRNIILPVMTQKTEVIFYIADTRTYTFVGDGTSNIVSFGNKFKAGGEYAQITAWNDGNNTWVISGDLIV